MLLHQKTGSHLHAQQIMRVHAHACMLSFAWCHVFGTCHTLLEHLPNHRLGPPSFFLSHWWGYNFVETVSIIEVHEARRQAEGNKSTLDLFQ